MADSDVKAMTENLEAETFDEIAFTPPVPLNKAKVATNNLPITAAVT